MLDPYFYPKINRFYKRILYRLKDSVIVPTHITIVGFGFGLAVPYFIWQNHYLCALLFFLLNRVLDGLDGALAQIQNRSSLQGGFLDICLDFCIYGLFALSFYPICGFAAIFLLFSFYLTATSFLALSSTLNSVKNTPKIAAFQHKSIRFVSGLCEGTETIIAVSLILLFPKYISYIAYIYGSLCIITAIVRVALGYFTLAKIDNK